MRAACSSLAVCSALSSVEPSSHTRRDLARLKSVCLFISHAYCTLLFPLTICLTAAQQHRRSELFLQLHPTIGFYACLRAAASGRVGRVAQGYA